MGDRRTYADRREYLIRAVQKRREKIHQMAIQRLGGKCFQCGYDRCGKALEFHHLDSSKDFGISEKGHARSWERVKAELERCVLLCASCHREVHAGLQLPWETMDEKPGEFSEALWGNPERSLSKGK
ncbi:hypothetical protein M1N13_02730 [Dehalococcoidia bacterium]|nr:hypothetical protein [Dehalococcoidia bacterium]MCL0049190.1 hypothetical protein [Dehalococcoidia bacterium]